ncbi:hypothetical protein K438DRAFT_1969563 [Mycena galopus ATCC 62051]|nr:hypothetical protein K438DRAFT_1969563 [Mycena galopus ATCC 62051]
MASVAQAMARMLLQGADRSRVGAESTRSNAMVFSNIETPTHSWVADGWPQYLHFRHALGIAQDGDVVEGYEIVPLTAQGLLGWAYVDTNPSATDRSRTLRLLYKSPPIRNFPGNTIFPVGVRVQGFVKNCNLRAMGNYKRGGQAQSAVQMIVLGGGDHGLAFAPYKHGVAGVIAHIHHCLNVPPPQIHPEQNDTMFIARRVFTLVTSKNCHMPSALSPGDDPTHDAAAIHDNWRVLKKLSVGMYVPDEQNLSESEFVPLDASEIRAGDFVDVCVGFDIVCRTIKGKRTVKVHLTIEHVLLLLAGQPVAAEVPVPALENVAEENPGLAF